jgi:hypothetical protein
MSLTLPTPQDAGLLLQDTASKTSNYSTTAFDLGAGFAPGGLGKPVAAIVSVGTIDFSSGNETYSFTLEGSDNNVSFTPIGLATSITAAGVVPVRGWITQRFVRLSLVVGGTTPSISFKAWLNPLTM